MSNTTEIPDRSDKKAFELYRHSVEMANIDGKGIERRARNGIEPEWVERGTAAGRPLDWQSFDYRLAPDAPKVAPWTFETVPSVAFKARRKSDGKLVAVFAYPEMFEAHESIGGSHYDALDGDQLLANYDMPDGTPCGTVQPSAEPEWPKWFRGNHGGLWRMESETTGRYLTEGGDTDESILDVRELATIYPQITAAEAEALIRKARAGK